MNELEAQAGGTITEQLQLQNTPPQNSSSFLDSSFYIFLIGFMVIMYFMTIRPQQKRMKALQTMMDDLEIGDEVVAAGGIIGRIKDIKGAYVSIEVSENITFKLQKTAISSTLPKGTIASIN
jgi:preprotein translocase subunit YajC|tara:strand:+ start:90 stop:455 length:366 start_codon:yes stop_codon:yes gene_type:complete